MSQPTAFSLLKDSDWFEKASPALLEALASKMTLMEVEDGYIFVKEGDPITNVLILQEGTLSRSKLSVEDAEHAQKHMTDQELKEHSILVDEVSGVGKITGLLHNVEDNAKAYATIAAVGHAKVWSLPGEDLRKVVCSEPAFALDVMSALARELRSGSKSLRSVLKQARTKASEEGGKSVFRVMCFDATSWTTDGFKNALELYKKEKKEIDICFDFTTERLSHHSATYAAGYDAVCLFGTIYFVCAL